ncbi:MAG: Glutamine-dependent NAD(+) synthetase [Phycisphaerae bacterium]|nr:Glutamine-dependent NAD(+) synthetase [Phycisphaerae bacterium]
MLAQLNPRVGDITANCAQILAAIEQAERQQADLIIFPELAILGYPPRDLLLRNQVIENNLAALQRIALASRQVAIVVGAVTRNHHPTGLPIHNSVVFCAGGQIVHVQPKCLLPNYDVFDERRYFEPANRTAVIPWTCPGGRSWRLGMSVCEDLWNDQLFIDHRLYTVDPIQQLADQKSDLFINISASPYWLGKHQQRLAIFTEQVRHHGQPLVYVNQVGGNDDLIFDGASLVLNGRGEIVAQAPAFQESLLLVDLEKANPQAVSSYPAELDSLIEALTLGLRDYVRKCGFQEVVIGLSGGIDSAVTAVLAVRALGPQNVHGVAMPSRFSSDHSLEDARLLAEALQTDYRVIPIHEMHAVTEQQLQKQWPNRPADTTEENLQARIRGQIMMALSNKFGWLVLTTGNKSELAVGYCTLYGDMCGGLAVISDVAKTRIYQLAERINAEAKRDLIPLRTISKPPSAELRPHQCDQDSLPPYDILDAILQLYLEQHRSRAEIIAAGFAPQIVQDVIRRVDQNEYKRRQSPPGLKITARAFGVGWRMPIAARVTQFDE